MVERNWADVVDQAAGLRRLFGQRRRARMIALVDAAGREGGVSLAMATAKALAVAGYRVVLVDEAGRAARACGCAGAELFDVLASGASIEGAVFSVAPNLRLVPAPRAARELESGEVGLRHQIESCKDALCNGADFVLIDSVIRRNRLSPLTLAAPHLTLALTADRETITRGYALLKRTVGERGDEGYLLAIKHAAGRKPTVSVADTVQTVAQQHLGISLDYIGAVEIDRGSLADALVLHLPPSAGNPATSASKPLPMQVPATRERFESVV